MRFYTHLWIPKEVREPPSAAAVARLLDAVLADRFLARGPGLSMQRRELREHRYGHGEVTRLSRDDLEEAIGGLEDLDVGYKGNLLPGSRIFASPAIRHEDRAATTAPSRAVVLVARRGRLVSMSDPHEGVTARASALPYGHICQRHVPRALYTHPLSGKRLEIEGSGAARAWIAVTIFGGDLPEPAADDALARGHDDFNALAREVLSSDVVEGCVWE